MHNIQKSNHKELDITVVIPLYNKEDTIVRALQSVVKQTFKSKEIIVINDGSTDDSGKVVISQEIDNLRYYEQKNKGVSATRNQGIRMASCEWIAFLDADDEWLPGYLEKLNYLHNTYPETSILATSYLLGKNNVEIKKFELKKIYIKNDGILTNYFEVASVSAPPICSSTVCIKKNALMKIGGFPENISSGEDLLTWARLAFYYEIAYSMTPLAIIWLDSAHIYQKKPNRIPDINDPVGKSLQELSIIDSEKIGLKLYISHWHKMRASIYLRLGKRRLSFNECKKSIRYNKANKKVYIYIMLVMMPSYIVRHVFKVYGN
jgi:glycosyltransferase involved in cell wall biosynthesis